MIMMFKKTSTLGPEVRWRAAEALRACGAGCSGPWGVIIMIIIIMIMIMIIIIMIIMITTQLMIILILILIILFMQRNNT